MHVLKRAESYFPNKYHVVLQIDRECWFHFTKYSVLLKLKHAFACTFKIWNSPWFRTEKIQKFWKTEALNIRNSIIQAQNSKLELFGIQIQTQTSTSQMQNFGSFVNSNWSSLLNAMSTISSVVAFDYLYKMRFI